MTENGPFDYHPPDIDRMRRFSELAGLEIADLGQRVDAFKQLSSQEFLDLLSVANGLLRDEQGFQRWSGEAHGSQVKYGKMSPDLDPPDHAEEEFDRLFADIQDTLEPNQDSIDEAAVRLYFGVVGAHMFPDGNGRLARSAYFLMKSGKIPEDKVILEQSATHAQRISVNVNTQAVVDVMLDAGLSKERIYGREFVADMTSEDFVANYGLSQHLKYIAILRLRQSAGLDADNEELPGKLIISEQTPEIQAGFGQTYNAVKSEWFQKFSTDIPRKYLNYCMQDIEGVGKAAV